ncbi:MAG: hypothetical protein HY372_02860 [Candidatus Andersenbacteria bacterium]|nr:hypothetical protein [Candidatus Andersenbacteria bacterium]
MQYYQCPKTFRHRPYGCGFGPVNASVAMLDLLLKCPHCGQPLKKIRSAARQEMAAVQEKLDAAAAAEQLFGHGTGAAYLARHQKRP